MKILLVFLIVMLGIGGWQGYSFYSKEVADDEATIAKDVAQIDSLTKQEALTEKSLKEESERDVRLEKYLDGANQKIEHIRTALIPVAAPVLPTTAALESFTPPSPLPAQANWTWNTTDGKVYKNVVVTKVEPDCATILDDDGGALVPIATLSPDIQKMCNYNPDLAASAKTRRQQVDQDSAVALNREKTLSNQIEANTDNTVDVNAERIRKQQQADADSLAAARRVLAADSFGDAQSARDDLDWAKKHVTIDPKTGAISGDSYWVAKYQADLAAHH